MRFRSALSRLLRAARDYELDEDGDEWPRSQFSRGFAGLPILF